MIDYQYIADYYNNFPLFIQIACALSVIMFLSIVFLTIYLKAIRGRLRKRREEHKKCRTEFEALLVEYLYSESDDEKNKTLRETIIHKLKTAVRVKYKRKIIISILYNLVNEVSGEMSESIKTLYHETGLIDYALARLKSKNWYIIAKSIGELRHFSIEEVHADVLKHIKHPKREVRKETHLYLVNLFRFEGLSFLDDIKTPLSEWDYIQILEILQNFDDQQICDIKPWLISNNDTVVLFALKLAQIYNQFEVKDLLMDLLSHHDQNVRITAIEVLTSLYGVEAKEMLKANFNDLSTEEQISFFKMLEQLVVHSDESFIEEHLFHKNFEVQLLALQILKSINLDKFIGLNKEATNENTSSMLEFVHNNA